MTAPHGDERVIRSVVPQESAGRRLDCYLAGRFTYFSRTQWDRAVREGRILLSGARVRPSKTLQGGETIEFHPPPETREPPVNTDYSVILETPDFLAINKPPCLPTHPAGRFFRNTLVMLLRESFGVTHPVNRLDRETSGVTLFAKSPSAASALSRLFLLHSPEKRYTAFVHGRFPEFLNAEGFLSPDPESPVRKKRRFTRETTGPDAESCATSFRLVAANDSYSEVECVPKTGRLHQIRATLCSLGFPMLGDKLYGPDPTLFMRHADGVLTDADRALLLLDHQALHAKSLKFRSPFTAEKLLLEAPAPKDLVKLSEQIRKNS